MKISTSAFPSIAYETFAQSAYGFDNQVRR